MIVNSKLLSGGFENRHFHLFSKKITEDVALYSSIANDNHLKEVILTVGHDVENESDKKLEVPRSGLGLGKNYTTSKINFEVIESAEEKLI